MMIIKNTASSTPTSITVCFGFFSLVLFELMLIVPTIAQMLNLSILMLSSSYS